MPRRGLFSWCIALACLPCAVCKLLLRSRKVNPRNTVREPRPSEESFASPDARVCSIDWSTLQAPVLPFDPFPASLVPSPQATPARAAHFNFTIQQYFPNTNTVPLHPPTVEASLVRSPTSFDADSCSTQLFTTTSLVPSITSQPPTPALSDHLSVAMEVVEDTRLRMSNLTVASEPALSTSVASSDNLSIMSLLSVDRPTTDFHPGCVDCVVLVFLWLAPAMFTTCVNHL
jgi:hypothetical protein